MIKKILTLIISATMLSVPTLAEKKTNDEKRAKILETREKILIELLEEVPNASAELQAAEGFATFSNGGFHLLLAGAGAGSGVVHDNASGVDTYMTMASVGVGLGLGAKHFRTVMVFNDRDALVNFLDKGWDFSADGELAAKADNVGGDVGGSNSMKNKVKIYQFTKNGLSAKVSLHGTKYWKSRKLNGE